MSINVGNTKACVPRLCAAQIFRFAFHSFSSAVSWRSRGWHLENAFIPMVLSYKFNNSKAVEV